MAGAGMVPAATRPVWPPIVALGIGAGCISGLQPLLLDLLRQAGKLDIPAMGLAATAEAAGMAIATTLAALQLPLTHLRRKALLALGAMILANSGTMLVSGAAIVALRFLNGVGAGLLLWILVGMLSRSAAPARLFAIYVTAQSVLALGLSQAISGLIAPAYGHVGAYGLLVALNMAMVLAVAMMADHFPATGATGRGLPGLRGLVLLLAMTAFIAGIMSLWVFLLPALGAAGFSAETAARAVPVGIASQIIGGLLAALLASRIGAASAWLLGIVVGLIAVFLITQSASVPLMLMGASLFGFIWIFVPPFHMPAILKVDPTGKGAMLVGTAQLAGSVAGPALAASFVTRNGIGAASELAIAWLALSLALLLAVQLSGRRT